MTDEEFLHQSPAYAYILNVVRKEREFWANDRNCVNWLEEKEEYMRQMQRNLSLSAYQDWQSAKIEINIAASEEKP